MLKTSLLPLAAFIAGIAVAPAAWSAVSAEEAAKLNTELTPLGAEKAGNKDGSIPAWTGDTRRRSPASRTAASAPTRSHRTSCSIRSRPRTWTSTPTS